MKKFLAAFCLSLLMFRAACAEENYDPQHTMLALNMAIVSVHRILTTGDRIVLEQEYQNIINNLSLGNIENDKDMTALYSDLTGIISRKGLRDEEAKFFRSRYDQREQNLINHALSRIQAQGENIVSLIGSFVVSCASSYFAYQAMKSDIAEDLRGEVWQLTKEDITDCNNLQERLLNSSWNLLRQYKLPDNYRLVQRTLDDFYKAVNEKDPAKQFRMLRALERDFQVYPPYWYYRGKTAQELGENSEAHSCFARFNEVWRPVLRQDPYKVEALKFELSEIVKGVNLSDEEKRRAFGILEAITENTPRDDWANRLFAGVAYFVLGEKDRGIEIVESNVDFGYGAYVSAAILTQLKAGKLNPQTLSSYIAGQVTSSTLGKLTYQMKDKQLAEALTAYFEGRENEAEKALESMSGTSENPVVFEALYFMNALKNYPKARMFGEKMGSLYKKDKEAFNQAFAEVKPLLEFYAEKQVSSAQYILGWMYRFGCGVKEDKAEAVNWYRKAAEQGYAVAQNNLGFMYSNGEGVKEDDAEAVKWFRKAAEQGYAQAQDNLGYMYSNGEGVKQDYKTAYMWYFLSGLSGYSNASDRVRDLETDGWFSSAKVSPSEAEEAKAEARRKYDEIRKRYGLD